MFQKTEIRVNRIRTQIEFVEMLRNRHKEGAKEKLNDKLTRVHSDVVDLLGTLLDKYSELMQLYDQAK